MVLNGRGIFHPRFTSAVARQSEGGMSASVLIRRVNTDFEPTRDWSAGKTNLEGMFTNIFRAKARIQPISDTSAKPVNFGNAMTAFQSVRIDIPMAHRIWVNPEVEDHSVLEGYQVVVEDAYFPALQPLAGYVFTVRNPVNSSNAPQWNLLCDLDMKSER